MITAEDAALIAALRGESARLQKQATAIEFDAQDLAYQAREIEDQYEQETTCDEASNEIGDRCSSCRWLHTKDTIDWSGACGKSCHRQAVDLDAQMARTRAGRRCHNAVRCLRDRPGARGK